MTYELFVVPLVKAVQELNTELKSEVASLKNENINLSQRLEKLESLMAVKDK
jgi:hypothetical protein